MAVVEVGGSDGPFRLRINDHHVCVEPYREASFSLFKARQSRRAFRHPMRNINERKASAACFRPHQREGQ